jgi:uncharacterized protein YggE
MKNSRAIPTIFVAFTVASAVTLVTFWATATHAEELRRTVRVQGTGISGAVPDMAEVSAGALTRASTATQAFAENNAAVAKVLALVADFKIPDRDVRTSGFSLTPIFERQQQRGSNAQAPTIIGYQILNNVSIKYVISVNWEILLIS